MQAEACNLLGASQLALLANITFVWFYFCLVYQMTVYGKEPALSYWCCFPSCCFSSGPDVIGIINCQLDITQSFLERESRQWEPVSVRWPVAHLWRISSTMLTELRWQKHYRWQHSLDMRFWTEWEWRKNLQDGLASQGDCLSWSCMEEGDNSRKLCFDIHTHTVPHVTVTYTCTLTRTTNVIFKQWREKAIAPSFHCGCNVTSCSEFLTLWWQTMTWNCKSNNPSLH